MRDEASRQVRRQSGRRTVCGRLAAAICLAGLLVGNAVLAQQASAVVRPPLTVGEIEIRTDPIFRDDELEGSPWTLQFVHRTMNALHVDTRQWVIRQELLLEPGDAVSAERLAETERALRSLGFLTHVRVAAVDTAADGRVKILVSAREAWTLQASFGYSRASSGDQRWNVFLAERNFLGLGTTLGAGIGADEHRSYWNGWIRQRRLFGSKLVLALDYAQRDDGHFGSVYLSRPFYALSDRFGLDVIAWENVIDTRYYLSNAGPAGRDPSREASLYATIPYRETVAEGRCQFRIAGRDSGRVWRLGAGARLTDRDFRLDRPPYEVSDGTWQDLGWLLEPGQPLTREHGLRVFPFVWLYSEGRRWARARFVHQYGPDEDLSLFWTVDAKIGLTGKAVGSTAGTGSPLRAECRLTRWYQAAGGYIALIIDAEAEAGSREDAYHRLNVNGGWVGQAGSENAPWLTRVFAEVGHGSRLTGTQAFKLGLDRGLRTLEYDGMAGDRLLRWNLEQGKVLPTELLGLFRMGLAAFYDGGLARWRDETRRLPAARHEVGLGLRFGPTRSANAEITRLDVTWDLGGGGPVFTAITRGFF